MSVTTLTADQLARALAVRDLTDPAKGRHALQRLVDDAVGALAKAWASTPRIYRGSRVITTADNYDHLGYTADAVTRDARYTRYVSAGEMLRSHTSALVPGALRTLDSGAGDVLIACPGVVYRRDSIDRSHSGTPHQLDLWCVTSDRDVTTGDLKEMIDIVVTALLPGAEYRVAPRVHPYTTNGLQIDVENGGEWVEIGECGLAARAVLERAGRPGCGLAMGLGLDRIVMLRKGIADIRLLRSSDPRVESQMIDLGPYRPVSSTPPIARDLSIAIGGDDDVELLGDRVRDALGAEAESVETVEIVSETPGAELSALARERLGLLDGQRNVLVRVVLRHPSRTLTRDEANELRDRVYAALHCGVAIRPEA
ncbi:MAG: PheS-related mystery ligase SrmL [Actinomycetota bacterium]